MFLPYHQNQNFLLPRSLSSFIGENHGARIISDLIESMNLSAFHGRYRGLGPPAYHPKMMLKVLLFGYTEGIFSSRKLAKACEESMPFISLSGMQTPVYKTFIEFRTRHQEEMQQMFTEGVRLAKALGLVRMGEVALDGTMIEANTSKHQAMSDQRMKDEEEKVRQEDGTGKGSPVPPASLSSREARQEDLAQAKEEIERLKKREEKIQSAKEALEKREETLHPGKAIDPKKQISFADPEARVFTKKSEGTEYVYNAQVAVDMESQIIVETALTDTTSDSRAVETMLERIEETTGELPEKLVADAGYGNVHTLESCEKAGVKPVVATAREGKKKTEGDEGEKERTPILSGFVREKEGAFPEALRCPHGILYLWIFSTFGKKRTYRAQGGEGGSCGCPPELRIEAGTFARLTLRQIQKEEDALYRKRKA